MLNGYRLTADFLHSVAILLIFVKVCVQRKPECLSRQTQLLLALVSATRYLDLFVHFVSVYNTSVKVGVGSTYH